MAKDADVGKTDILHGRDSLQSFKEMRTVVKRFEKTHFIIYYRRNS